MLWIQIGEVGNLRRAIALSTISIKKTNYLRNQLSEINYLRNWPLKVSRSRMVCLKKMFHAGYLRISFPLLLFSPSHYRFNGNKGDIFITLNILNFPPQKVNPFQVYFPKWLWLIERQTKGRFIHWQGNWGKRWKQPKAKTGPSLTKQPDFLIVTSVLQQMSGVHRMIPGLIRNQEPIELWKGK